MAESRQQVAGSADLPLAQDAAGRLIIGASFASTPELKDRIFNTPIALNTDFFTPDLVPTNTPTTFRIYASFDTGGALSVQRTSGGVTVAEVLNSGTALVVNAAYMFDILVHVDDAINLQYSAAAQILCCMVIEVAEVIS